MKASAPILSFKTAVLKPYRTYMAMGPLLQFEPNPVLRTWLLNSTIAYSLYNLYDCCKLRRVFGHASVLYFSTFFCSENVASQQCVFEFVLLLCIIVMSFVEITRPFIKSYPICATISVSVEQSQDLNRYRDQVVAINITCASIIDRSAFYWTLNTFPLSIEMCSMKILSLFWQHGH